MKRCAASLFSKAVSGACVLLILASPFPFPAAPGLSSVAHRSCPRCGSSWVVLAFPTPFLVFPVLAVLAILAIWAVVLVVFVPVAAIRYSCQVLFPIVSVVPIPQLFGCRPRHCIPHPPDPPRLCCPRCCLPNHCCPLAFGVVLSAFPVLRGGVVSDQVARLLVFCVLTSQAPRYLGLLVHAWGLLTANDPLTSHFDGEEAVCVLLL